MVGKVPARVLARDDGTRVVGAGKHSQCRVFPAPSGRGELQLCTDGHQVIVSCAGHMLARYTQPSPVVQAGFCVLSDDESAYLLVLIAQRLVMYAAGGTVSDTVLPCRMARFLPLHGGTVLLQRSDDLLSGDQFDNVQFPSLFTVSDALGELKPVLLSQSDARRFVTDAQDHIIAVSDADPCLLITWHAENRHHTLWLLQSQHQAAAAADRAAPISPVSATTGDDEALVAPEFVLTCVWQEDARHRSACSVVFHHELVCLLDRTLLRLVVRRCDRDAAAVAVSATPVMLIDALDVASVCERLVVLTPDGALDVYHDDGSVLLRIAVSMPEAAAALSTGSCVALRFTALRDPVSDRITLCSAYGDLRVALPLQCRSWLVSLCFQRLLADTALSSATVRQLQCETLVAVSRQPGSAARVAAAEWPCFAAVVLRACGEPDVSCAQADVQKKLETALWQHQRYHISALAPVSAPSIAPQIVALDEDEEGNDARPVLSGAQSIALLHCLHTVYQHCQLDMLHQRYAPRLARLLIPLVARFAPHLLHMYRRDGADVPAAALRRSSATPQADPPARGADGDGDQAVPLFDAIRRLLGGAPTAPGDARALATADSEGWLAVVAALRAMDHGEAVAMEMARRGITQQRLHRLPLGLAIPVLDVLAAARAAPPDTLSPAAFRVLGRDDRAAIAEQRVPDVAARGAAPGLQALLHHPLVRLRFNADARVRDAWQMLDSSQPVPMDVPPGDADDGSQTSAQLACFAMRTMALPVGRGMLTLSLRRPLTTEPAPVPELVLAARLSTNGAVVKMDTSQYPETMTSWPSFHNGVAAGLSLEHIGRRISKAWIIYNMGAGPSDTTAGLLMALGLQGQLSELTRRELYSQLSYVHELTAVGVMIGIAAARRGTMCRSIVNTLALHVPAMLPPSPDLDVPIHAQTAAIVGIGLLYLGTAQRQMASMLLEQISRRVRPSMLDSRASYSLAAGLALGMVTLGAGDAVASLADLHLERKLQRGVSGGSCMRGSGSSGIPIPGEDVGASEADHNDGNRLYEGDAINVNITAPGSLVALGLMFLKTGNQAVAQRLAMPSSRFLLQRIRADHVALRVAMRALILWDSVQPSEEWISSCVPDVIRGALPDHEQLAGGRAAFPRTTAPVGADAATADAATASGGGSGSGSGVDQAGPVLDEDHQTTPAAAGMDEIHALWHTYELIRAGACLAIGLRYAGSQHAAAHALLLRQARALHRLYSKAGAARRSLLSPAMWQHCINMVVLADAMVMAGTGNLDLMRVLRALRRPTEHMAYGHHMATHMALGFLFLGGGLYTLSTSNDAIAGLVAAVYPWFPRSPTDNTQHLQALRHLWMLAVVPRRVEAWDVDTKQPVLLPLTLQLQDGQETELIAPALLPPAVYARRVSVRSPRYWTVGMRVRETELHNGARESARHVLWVRRKACFLSYQQDPLGTRCIHSRSLPKVVSAQSEFLAMFTESHGFRTLLRHFQARDGSSDTLLTPLVLDVLGADKAHALPALLHLALTPRHVSTASVRDLCLLQTWYHAAATPASLSSPSSSWTRETRVVEPTLLHSVLLQVEQLLHRSVPRSALRAMLIGQEPEEPSCRLLAALAMFYDLPRVLPPSALQMLRSTPSRLLAPLLPMLDVNLSVAALRVIAEALASDEHQSDRLVVGK